MATSDHLFNKCDQAIKQMKNQIITLNSRETIKKQEIAALVCGLSNGCSVLYSASFKSRTHYSIALKFSVVQLE